MRGRGWLLLAVGIGTLACQPAPLAEQCETDFAEQRWEDAAATCGRTWNRTAAPEDGLRWARAAAKAGDFDVARTLLLDVDPESLEGATLNYLIAVDDHKHGRFDDAEQHLLACWGALERGREWPRAIKATRRLGRIRYTRGDYEGAESVYEAAITLAHRTGDKSALFEVLLDLAALYREMGYGLRADAVQTEAIAMFPKRAESLGTAADLARRRGRHEMARTLYVEASAAFRQKEDWSGTRVADLKLIDFALDEGDVEEAKQRQRSARQALDKLTKGAPLPELPPNLRSSALFYEGSVLLAAGDVEGASSTVERALEDPLGPDWAWQFHLLKGNVEHARGATRAAYDEWLSALTVDSDANRTVRAHTNRRRRRAADSAVLAALELGDIDAHLAAVNRRNSVSALGGGSTLDSAATALGSSNAIAYTVTSERLLVVSFVDGRWSQSSREISRDQLDALVDAFEEDPRAESGRRLSAVLLPPIIRESDTLEPLFIVPDGPLERVSFAALPAGDGYLIETADVFFTPALGPEPPSEVPSAPVAAVFVADPGGDLPGARAEALAWADPLGARLYVGDAATSDLVLGKHMSLLHAGVHAGADGGSPWLEFADRRVTASEFAESGASAETVVLASCATATRADNLWTSTPVALLNSGSKTVVGTLRSVSDDATIGFVAALYQGRSLPLPPTSTQAAQRTLLRAHPVEAWAPFVALAYPTVLKEPPK